MNPLYALGVFMKYAHDHWQQSPQNQALYSQKCREILGSPASRFADCSSVNDLFAELDISEHL